MSLVTTIVVLLLALAVGYVLLGRWLRGADHTQFDSPKHPLTGTRTEPSAQHNAAVAGFANAPAPTGSQGERLAAMRAFMDSLGDNLETDASITPVDAGGVPAEWVVAPGVPTSRRMLYLHGGGFMLGSPRSHRAITARMSQVCQAAVLAIDYRLMPENPRLASVEDSRTAYRWILENGPDGATPPEQLFVAGDSAGGNLTLHIIAWARDEGLRPADVAIGLSPATDATFSSPSLRRNLDTDVMLGPMLRPMLKLPRTVAMLFGAMQSRVRPCNPVVSPLHGDLSNLPPTLVQASTAEVLEDDAVRWVNKATAAGSTATVQTWPFMLHVWHAFVTDVPEAQEAFVQIEAFVQAHAPLADAQAS